MLYFYHKGFSLIEVMVSIFIMVIIVSIAIPSFASFSKSTRVDTTKNDLYFILQYAKSEALKRKESIIVCNSVDGVNCVDSTQWDQEKIIAKITTGDMSETVLRVITLNKKDILIQSELSSVKFLRNGELEVNDKITVKSKGCEVLKTGIIMISKIGMLTHKVGTCDA